MKIHRHGREHYDVQPVTDPPLSAWEASFDRGTSWVAGTALTGADAGWFRWLVAGPSADPGTAVVLPVGTHAPLARAVDTTEIVVRTLPNITVTD